MFKTNAFALSDRLGNRTLGVITFHHVPHVFTECRLYRQSDLDDNNESRPVATAMARVHPNDQFSKGKGRRIALARLLKEFFPINRSMRERVFAEYEDALARSVIVGSGRPDPDKMTRREMDASHAAIDEANLV